MANTSPRQEPFVYGSLGGRTVALVDGPVTAADDPATSKPPAGATALCNEALQPWREVRDTTSIAALQAFIRRYGDCFYGDLARVRIDELTKVAAVPPPAPAARPPVPAPPPVTLPAPPPERQATAPPTLLADIGPASRWAIGSASNCDVPRSAYALTMGDGTITWRNGLGSTDVEAVDSSSEDTFRTTTRASNHADRRNERPGQTWTYARNGADRIRVTPGGRSPFVLFRCQ
jgi:hypothetical protein